MDKQITVLTNENRKVAKPGLYSLPLSWNDLCDASMEIRWSYRNLLKTRRELIEQYDKLNSMIRILSATVGIQRDAKKARVESRMYLTDNELLDTLDHIKRLKQDRKDLVVVIRENKQWISRTKIRLDDQLRFTRWVRTTYSHMHYQDFRYCIQEVIFESGRYGARCTIISK